MQWPRYLKRRLWCWTPPLPIFGLPPPTKTVTTQPTTDEAITAHSLPLMIQSEPFVVCPLCGCGAAAGFDLIDDFFHAKPLVCAACGETIDAWAAYLTTLAHPVPFLNDFAAFFVGFKTAFFNIELAPTQIMELNLSDYGVPAGSRLIRLNYTPTGLSVLPTELHGNEALIRRGRDKIFLYGRPGSPSDQAISPPDVSAPIKVHIYVTFASPNDVDEQAEDALGKAFAALGQNEFVDMVIPAAMAVEFTCKRLITDFTSIIGSATDGQKDKDLLTKVVPKIANAVGISPLHKEICTIIGRLWGQRDAVAHTGRLHQPYVREHAARQLAAAVFAFRYLTLLRRMGTAAGLI